MRIVREKISSEWKEEIMRDQEIDDEQKETISRLIKELIEIDNQRKDKTEE